MDHRVLPRLGAVGFVSLAVSATTVACLAASPPSALARTPGECIGAGEVGGAPTTSSTGRTTVLASAKAKPEPRPKPREPARRVTLQVVPPSLGINFGAGRKKTDRVFRLVASRPLSRRLVSQLVPVADPMLRSGETTTSVAFPEPTFSKLALSRDRKTIRVRVCLDPQRHLEAGKYTGVVTIDGPGRVRSDTLTLTANTKNGGWFIVALVVGLFVTGFVLLYKSLVDATTAAVAEAEAMPETTDAERAAKRKALRRAKRLLPYVTGTLLDPRWFVPTGAALTAAFGAVWVVYDTNPAWGETGFVSSAIAVVGAMLSAIGAKTIFSGAR